MQNLSIGVYEGYGGPFNKFDTFQISVYGNFRCTTAMQNVLVKRQKLLIFANISLAMTILFVYNNVITTRKEYTYYGY